MKTRTFLELWEVSDKVEGWFTEEEAKAMYQMIKSVPKEGTVVELGSYCGRSSIIIGALAKDIGFDFYCVDDFSSGEVEDKFKHNMEWAMARYKLIRGKSTEVQDQLPNNIDFIFFDTIHIYEHQKKECDIWLPKMKKEGLVAFHDYGGKYHGVKTAVDEREELQQVAISYSTLFAKVK